MIVDFTAKGWWATAHGILFAAAFLLLLLVVFGSLLQLRSTALTAEGVVVRVRWLKRSMLAMMLVGWTAVAIGTFVVDAWFNRHLAASPYSMLDKSGWWAWQERVMEWKERIGWVSAALATCGFYLVSYYGAQLAHDVRARSIAATVCGLALAAATLAGVMGQLLAKLVPLR